MTFGKSLIAAGEVDKHASYIRLINNKCGSTYKAALHTSSSPVTSDQLSKQLYDSDLKDMVSVNKLLMLLIEELLTQGEHTVVPFAGLQSTCRIK